MSLVARLEACKGKFGPDAAREVLALLKRVERTRFRDTEELIQLHETVMFLRAYPQSAQVLRLTDRILFSFGERVRGMPREDFEYSDVSGIVGTGLTTNFSYPFARSLAERYSGCVSIDWEQFPHAERLVQFSRA